MISKQNISLAINLLMSIIYIGCGVFLLAGDKFFNFSELQKIAFGNVLILYGMFRLYSFIKKFRSKNSED